jgi:hypothetical protein
VAVIRDDAAISGCAGVRRSRGSRGDPSVWRRDLGPSAGSLLFILPFLGAILGITGCLIAPWRHSTYAIPILLVLDPTPVGFAVAAIRELFN